MNVSNSSVTITNLELIAHERTFPYEQVGPNKYPITIKPGKSATIPVWFDLDHSYLSAVFKDSVELRVLYESDGAKGSTSVALIGEK